MAISSYVGRFCAQRFGLRQTCPPRLGRGENVHSLRLALFLLLIVASAISRAAEPSKPSLEDVLAATLHPYEGASVHGVDTSTLTGKVMCGYQGWFNCEGDGAQRGWVHWVKGPGKPSAQNIKVDLWPDITELGPTERFDTDLHYADGRAAQVFSSFQRETVLRHFQWMRDYAIDGAFVQRFASGTKSPDFLRHGNTVLAHCREAANRFGRAYALMYDLSGLGADRIDQVIEDWRAFRTRMKLCADPAYLHHHGKPLVAVWGIGFNDHRAYTLAECRRLVDFLKNDPEAGGCAVMLGIPTYWREGTRDAMADPALREIIAMADVASPWTVGRYGTPEEAKRYAEKMIVPDRAWCDERHVDYLPVIFPGFSWHNMYPSSAPNSVPRLKGEFFWSQFQGAKRASATMLYVAMFDEVDEGTAIFKCTNEPPGAERVPFVTYEGLPSDYYLRLAGAGGKMLRGEVSVEAERPAP